MPEPTYIVQLTSDPVNPLTGVRPSYEVSEGEYERLIDLGLVLNAPADPSPADLFDTELAAELLDPTSASYAAGRASFTPRATTLPPVDPDEGELWFSYA